MNVNLLGVEIPAIVVVPSAVFWVCNKGSGAGVESCPRERGVVAAHYGAARLVIPLYRACGDREERGAGDPVGGGGGKGFALRGLCE